MIFFYKNYISIQELFIYKILILTELFVYMNKYQFSENDGILINNSLFSEEEDSPQLCRVQFQ